MIGEGKPRWLQRAMNDVKRGGFDMSTGNERNSHGKYLEYLLRECSGGLMELDPCETAADDGILKCSLFENIPISVKNKGERGELCMGSFKNVIDHRGDEILIYGLHEPYNAHPFVIYAIYLPNGALSLYELSGHADQYDQVVDFVNDFEDYLTTTNDINEYKYDKEWCRQRKMRRDRYFSLFSDAKRGDIVIQPRPKRDHKSQHRLQCAIPRRKLEEITRSFIVAKYDDPALEYLDDPRAWQAFFESIIEGVAAFKGVKIGDYFENRIWNDRDYDPEAQEIIERRAEDGDDEYYDSIERIRFDVTVDSSDFFALGEDDEMEPDDIIFDEIMEENDRTYDAELAYATYFEDYYENDDELIEDTYGEDDIPPYDDEFDYGDDYEREDEYCQLVPVTLYDEEGVAGWECDCCGYVMYQDDFDGVMPDSCPSCKRVAF